MPLWQREHSKLLIGQFKMKSAKMLPLNLLLAQLAFALTDCEIVINWLYPGIATPCCELPGVSCSESVPPRITSM